MDYEMMIEELEDLADENNVDITYNSAYKQMNQMAVYDSNLDEELFEELYNEVKELFEDC